MKLEISLKTSLPAKQHLLAGLADLLSDHYINKITTWHNDNHFELIFFFEADSPENFLQNLSAAAARIENSFPQKLDIDIQIKNTAGSEPSLCLEKNGKPFFPVKGIRIVPWTGGQNIKPAADDILLDPAGAFGNGLHPSTRLCLQLLKQAADRDAGKKGPSRSVLDLGCGSGILAIAALRLGASRALGIEIDQQAAQAARRNVQINQLADSAQILNTSWQSVSGQYDLVLANLVPSVLFKAVPSIARLLNKQGLLITSGFPAAKKMKVLELFEQKGLRVLNELSLDGWGALQIIKQHSAGAAAK
jgi:ribosomal protein L11 methyltransferase